MRNGSEYEVRYCGAREMRHAPQPQAGPGADPVEEDSGSRRFFTSSCGNAPFGGRWVSISPATLLNQPDCWYPLRPVTPRGKAFSAPAVRSFVFRCRWLSLIQCQQESCPCDGALLPWDCP